MGMIRTLGFAEAVAGTPTPVVLAAADYAGVVIATTAYSFKNGIGTLTLASALPATGYNPGANSRNLQAGLTQAGGDKVTLWGFTTATWLNGKVVTVIHNDPFLKQFSFYFSGQDGDSGSDTGNTAPSDPTNVCRAVRLECGASLGTDIIYVGDLFVSSSRYMAALTLAGQLSIEIVGENIPADQIFIDTSGTSSNDGVQVTLIY